MYDHLSGSIQHSLTIGTCWCVFGSQTQGKILSGRRDTWFNSLVYTKFNYLRLHQTLENCTLSVYSSRVLSDENLGQQQILAMSHFYIGSKSEIERKFTLNNLTILMPVIFDIGTFRLQGVKYIGSRGCQQGEFTRIFEL